LGIVFDRPDRRYRSGEEVTGNVQVQVNRDVECRGVLLERFWQTHGRGNTTTGPKQADVLEKGFLRAGQVLSFPFRFTAPDGPPTYHGRYLNVDHYVHLRVDVPWAIDPKLKEEYVLLPGPRRYGNLPAPASDVRRATKSLGAIGVPLGVGLLVLGFIFIFPFGPFLIPAGLIVLFFALRKKLAEKRIGQVKLAYGATTVAPGGSVPLRLRFVPRKSSHLNRITAKLVGRERCVSGSGTNRTTHTHKFHERTFELLSERDVTAGSPVQLELTVPIPQTDAFSFYARDNALQWELEIRVDIPMWPDWIDKRQVIVRPPVGPEVVTATAVEEAPPLAAGPAQVVAGAAAAVDDIPLEQPSPPAHDPSGAEPGAGEPVGADEAAWREALPSEETPAPEPAPTEAPPPEQPPPASEPATAAALVGIVGQIATADRYSREREKIIERNAEQPFPCAVEINRAERTYTYIPDERFRKGRTVTGKLRGTDCEVTVELSSDRNDEIDALEPGSLIGAHCKLLKWNTIYDRLEMREA
jgi:hypothetical protein